MAFTDSIPGAEEILVFLPLAAVIALVCSGTRRDAPGEILAAAGKFFLYLVLGTAVFSAVLQVSLLVSALYYALVAAVAALLLFYTFQEVRVWLRGGTEAAGKGKEGARGAPPEDR